MTNFNNFNNLKSTFKSTIFSRSFFCDFNKVTKNVFAIKVQLSILGSLLGEGDIENKFIRVVREYPEVREVLPILLAVRGGFDIILDQETKEELNLSHLFKKNIKLDNDGEQSLLKFFRDSGLKGIFSNKSITNLNDYVFGVEAGLDSNARKNRSGFIMENIVLDFVSAFCLTHQYSYKHQATADWIVKNWGVSIESDKSKRIFDYAIFTGSKLYLLETNFYGGGGSKLKAVAGEFSGLYNFLKAQNIDLIRITDGGGWQKALKPLEEAYIATNGNIFNLRMLGDGVLQNLIV